MKIYDPVGFSSKLTGSFSGSFVGDGSEVTGIISSSYAVTASYAHNALSSSYAISASNALTASHGENFVISGSFNIGDYTWPTTDGTYGVEVLTTDGAGTLTWEFPKAVWETVKNVSGQTLAKGTPVHATSSGTGGNVVGIIAASASNASTMPATYILHQSLDDEEEGLGIVVGFITGVNTSAFNEGDVVYVGASGGYTNVKPTGSNLIQNLGIVTKADVNGSGVVYGSGRSNDVPNIAQGYAWVGNNNQVATATTTSSFFVTSGSHATTASYINPLEQDVIVTGSITSTSDIIAQTLHVQQVTSSIVYSSGSNIFGNQLTDTHQFTGSVSITGSSTFSNYGDAHFLNGSVGIGTASPVQKLDIEAGHISVDAGYGLVWSGDVDRIVTPEDNTTGGLFKVASGAATRFMRASSESMRIDGNGNVGIGTNSPEEILDVSGSVLINNNEFYKVESTAGTNYKIAGLTSGNVIQVGAIDYTSAGTTFAGGDSVSITTGGASGTTRMYISGSGNVGIGTTSPETKLDIFGPTQDQLRLRTAGSEYYRIGRDSSDGLLYFYGSQTGYTGYVFDGVDGERMRIDSSGNAIFSGTYLTVGNEGFIRSDDSGYLHLQGGTTGTRFFNTSNTTPLFTILNNGNVLINNTTDNTYDKLQVIGNAYIGGNATRGVRIADGGTYASMVGINQAVTAYTGLELRASGTNGQLFLSTNGYVGIGTTSPSYKTQINVTGNGETALAFMNSAVTADGNGSTNIRFVSATNAQWANASFSAYNYSFFVNGSEKFTILGANGNVGIGNTSPYSALTVGTYQSTHHVDSATLPNTPGNHLINLTPPATTNYFGGGISWSEGTNTAASLGVYDAGGGGALGMYFATGDNTTLTERMRITNGGEVGIGVFPATTLHIANTSSSSTTQRISAASNTATYSYITHTDNTVNTARLKIGAVYGYNTPVDAIEIFNGRVGINGLPTTDTAQLYSTTPGSSQIESGLRIINPYGFASAGTGVRLAFAQDRSTSENYEMAAIQSEQTIAGTSTDGDLVFLTRGSNSVTEKMRINSGGNVNILNATATDSKHIGITNAAGTTGWTFGNGVIASSHQFVVYDNTAGSARILINASGNVGIGTTSPIAKLDVSGNTNQHHSVSTTHNGGWRNIQNLGAAGWLDQTYSAGRLKVFGYENGSVNISYCEYYVIRHNSGYSLNQIGTRLSVGNGHGQVDVQISGNYLQVKNALNSSLGVARVVFSGMKD